jgi:signal transduction histidine kinase
MKIDQKTTMDDVLEMISGFESGNFSRILAEPEDPKLKPLVDKLNSVAKVLAIQSTQAAQDASFIVDSLGIGIWKWDLITNSLDWDLNMYRLYGCDPKDFIGAYDAWENSLSSETKAKAVQEINIAVAGGKSFDTTFQVVQRNTGKIQEIRTRAFVIRDDAGKPLKMWGINIDRTREAELEKEVKLALKSLEEASKFLEQTGEMAKVGGWELDLKTGNVHMTRQTQILHEIDANYVPPQYSTGGEWYPTEAWPVVQSAVKAAIEQGKPYDLESPFITAKGRRIWVRVQGYPLKEEGKVTALRGTFQDITERKKSAEEMAKMNLQLIQSSKLASLGEMAAGIAHEINNPLAIISGSVGLLSKNAENPEKLASKVQVIKKSCDRIARIVQGLKKFSRSADKANIQQHDLSNIIKEATIITEAKSKRHSTPVTVDCNSNLKVACDDVEIEQVIVNLINNSIDAVKTRSQKWVKISLFDDVNFIVLRITDSGPGIPENIRNKLFDPFFTTKNVGEGTGLGLSITKGILDEHKATITLVADSPNTCFEIRFPSAK